MRLHTKLGVMCVGLTLLVAGIAGAAPQTTEGAAKAEEKTCVRGEGREFVDKSESLYISKCEVGNAGFFTATTSSKKAKNAAFASASCCATDSKGAKDVKTVSAEECAPGAACCEVGNAGFFRHAASGGQHAQGHAKKAKSEKKAKDSASR